MLSIFDDVFEAAILIYLLILVLIPLLIYLLILPGAQIYPKVCVVLFVGSFWVPWS